IAMAFAMDSLASNEDERVADFIGEAIRKHFGDETVNSMLIPIRENGRSELLTVRKLVTEGSDSYLKGDNKGSLEAYQKAALALQNMDSPFDQLWLDLNRANSEIRLGQIQPAQAALESVVKQARSRNYKWVLASALSTYGSLRPLNSSF